MKNKRKITWTSTCTSYQSRAHWEESVSREAAPEGVCRTGVRNAKEAQGSGGRPKKRSKGVERRGGRKAPPVLPWMRLPVTIPEGAGTSVTDLGNLHPNLASALAKGAPAFAVTLAPVLALTLAPALGRTLATALALAPPPYLAPPLTVAPSFTLAPHFTLALPLNLAPPLTLAPHLTLAPPLALTLTLPLCASPYPDPSPPKSRQEV